MGTAKRPQPVKLVASLFSGDLALLDAATQALEELFGPMDFTGPLWPFDHTAYYEAEFGPNLQRRIIAFARLIDPGDLATIKLRTNELEARWLLNSNRRVNIDPGYVSLGKLVLASTKDHSHRVYLRDGIYAEVTLQYRAGFFQPWPWTYPDYASRTYCALFEEIRRLYLTQLRQSKAV